MRSDLRGQIDQSLTQRAQGFVGAPLLRDSGGLRRRPARRCGAADLRTGGRRTGPLPRAVQPARFGGARAATCSSSRPRAPSTCRAGREDAEIPPNAAERAIAAKGSGRVLSDRTVKGTHLRVFTVGTTGFAGARGAVMIARPLTEVDHELSRILLILLVVGVAGIALAALLGALVARTALAPIARFTRRTESLAGELEPVRAPRVSGGEELGAWPRASTRRSTRSSARSRRSAS